MTLDQMWARLESHQSYANQRDYGPEWAQMCAERTEQAAWAAKVAAEVPSAEASKAAAAASWAMWAAAALSRVPPRAETTAWAERAVKWVEQAEKIA